MTKILTKADRDRYPKYFDQMFRARAEVFFKRLRWNVVVHDDWEIDRYDEEEDPVYLVTVEDRWQLSGSLRLLPTTGQTMLTNEFVNFFDEPVDVESPVVWECTRFCIHPNALEESDKASHVSNRLLIGLCELCLSSGIEQIVGVYDNRMNRVYGRIGWTPVPLATARSGSLAVGVWDVSESVLISMRDRLARLNNNSRAKAA